jgi:polyisoprenoid-binding protein YceI
MSDAPKGEWIFDPSHTRIEAVARHMVVTKVRGHFSDFSGKLEFGEDWKDSSVEVEIQAASISSGNGDRDGHLKSPDFLDVENYPTITFVSTEVEPKGDSALNVTGDLTIRGISHPVVLDVTYEGSAVDPWGGTREIFNATTEIDREAWGMSWNQALESGGVLVSKKLRIEIEAQAVLAQAKAA